MSLTKEELERYSRQIVMKEISVAWNMLAKGVEGEKQALQIYDAIPRILEYPTQ